MSNVNQSEKPFVPRPGQVDFTNARYCPVVNTIVKNGHKILLVRRSSRMRLYPGVWNGISGFLDDMKTIQEKVAEELSEELGMPASAILSIQPGPVLVQEAPEYSKVWLVTPVLADVATTEIKLDWEASEYRWVSKGEALQLPLLPGFDKVMEAVGV